MRRCSLVSILGRRGRGDRDCEVTVSGCDVGVALFPPFCREPEADRVR